MGEMKEKTPKKLSNGGVNVLNTGKGEERKESSLNRIMSGEKSQKSP